MKRILLGSGFFWLTLCPAISKEIAVQSVISGTQAFIVPAKDWCSPVVSIEIRSKKAILEKELVEVQRLIGGTRGAIAENCPVVEMVRLRGLDKASTLFFGYTTKADNWRIRMVDSEADMFKPLYFDIGQPAVLREIAGLETRSFMARLGLDSLVLEPGSNNAAENKIKWHLEGISGATLVTIARGAPEKDGSELADQISNELINGCTEPENLELAEAGPAILLHSFDCKVESASIFNAVVSIRIWSMTTHFILKSPDKARAIELMRLLADEKLVY